MEQKVIKSIALVVLLLLFSPDIYAQSASLRGVVFDTSTGERLPGANVSLEGTSKGSSTDIEGVFTFRNLEPGTVSLIVSYIGYEDETIEVTLEPGERTEVEVNLTDRYTELEGIVISGYRSGQSRALNQQRTSSNIKNVVSSELIRTFPDHNTAEALQRIPGISIERDQGEGRYVQIRGTEARLSLVSINGEQIPSPKGDIRTVALDVIPSNMLSSIEVTKAITPDMDGDAIGGSINLNTLRAPNTGSFFEGTLAGGYNNNAGYVPSIYGNGAFTYGQRFGKDQQWGLVIGGSYNETSRSTDNNEMAYSDTELEEIVLQDDEIIRERAGFTTTLDYRFNESSEVYLSGVYNYFSDQEYSRAMKVETDAIERELKDRFEAQTIMNLAAGGTHLLNDNLEIDYKFSYSYAEENTDPEYVTIFKQEYEDSEGESIDFMELSPDDTYPQYSLAPGAPAGAGVLNYDRYASDEFEFTRELTTDQHFTSRLNMKSFYDLGSADGFIKFGGLFRAKAKDLNPEKTFYTYEGPQTYRDLLGSFEDTDFLSNQYEIGRTFGVDTMRDLFQNERPNFEYNSEDTFVDSRAEDYDATENTFAGYAMTELNNGPLTAIVGARFENTQTDYEGYSVEFDEEGDLIPVAQPRTGKRTFNFFLPMAHLKYGLLDDFNIRLAWTNTFAKPNYFDLAPYRIANRGDEELEQGNPDLDPTRSMNLDAMVEYYFSSVGVVSGGVFYKDITDFRYKRLFESQDPMFRGYEVEQPVNGDEATIFGFELNWQQQLTFLPGFMSGFGVYANYTYSWSEAEVFGETEEDVRTVTLPGQSESVANFALSYQKSGFSGRISANYGGAFVSELRDSKQNDRYYDERLQIDVSASQELSSRLSVFAEVLNLTNEPLRYYNGVSSRPEQQDFYSWWANAGVKIRL